MSLDSRVPPSAARSAGRLLDPRLAALVTDLRRADLRCSVLRLSVLGEQDVRIEVCVDGSPATAELLWEGFDAPAPPCWHAVRVLADERAVWRGPGVGCPRPELVRFLADLLTLDPARLGRRYALLG